MKPTELSPASRYVILAAAFLGWMLSGIQMTVMSLASGPATEEFARSGLVAGDVSFKFAGLAASPRMPGTSIGSMKLPPPELLKKLKNNWYSFYNSAFLLGAASGGLLFGWIADWTGRVRAMGASILCYSLFAGAGYVAATPEQLLLLRFLSGMGVGGMWPTGVSLAAEAWSDVSRPALAGLLGASANLGIVLLSAITWFYTLETESWRWIMLVGLAPAALGLVVLVIVPESPAWLRARGEAKKSPQPGALRSLFSPPLLPLTLIGIALGTIPLLGGWGVTSWLIPWTEYEAQQQQTADASPTVAAQPGAKAPQSADQKKAISQARALTAIMRASGGALGSLFGGWIANQLGRRVTYFLISLCSFGLSEFIYLFLHPLESGFSAAVFAIGCVSTVFFGWLPLYLPELFPTHARATGSGISFNFGRILTAVGVLGTGTILHYVSGNYRIAGGLMSLIYAVGMLVILLAPDTTKNRVGSG
jgi:SHS family sialic acid transporter-like MFS transporter